MEVEWYTTDDILERVRKVLGTIDLDPASSPIAQQRVQAEHYYTVEDDGLVKPWFGNVFCNPPYDQVRLRRFTQRFLEHYDDRLITAGIMLTNSGTDTQWNLPLQRGVQVYTNDRIEFLQPCGNPKAKGSRGQLFTYFGPNPALFVSTFCDDGFCWMPNRHLTPY